MHAWFCLSFIFCCLHSPSPISLRLSLFCSPSCAAIWWHDRFQKRNIESITINKAKEMIDIDSVISFNNNSKNNSNNNNNNTNNNSVAAQRTSNGASSVVDADKISPMPFTATTMTTAMLLTSATANNTIESNDSSSAGDDNDYSGRHIFKSSTPYANAFNIETIVLLFMFTVCTIVYSSKYRISPTYTLTLSPRICTYVPYMLYDHYRQTINAQHHFAMVNGEHKENNIEQGKSAHFLSLSPLHSRPLSISLLHHCIAFHTHYFRFKNVSNGIKSISSVHILQTQSIAYSFTVSQLHRCRLWVIFIIFVLICCACARITFILFIINFLM